MGQDPQGLQPVSWATSFLGTGDDAITYRWARENYVPSIRVGRRVLFSPEQLRQWRDQGGRSLDEVRRGCAR